jgi:inositol phosphorylceramide mannosyltransferase catalytic subunit
MVRNIHQMWKTPKLPAGVKTYQLSWKKHHPNWAYVFWTDSAIQEFLSTEFSWFLPIYNTYPYDIQRVDAARYFILYTFGGIYADIDYEVFAPVDECCKSYDVALINKFNRTVSNFLMYSEMRSRFFYHVIGRLEIAHQHTNYAALACQDAVFQTTGPTFLTDCLLSFVDRRSVGEFDHREFDPYNRHRWALPRALVRSTVLKLKGLSRNKETAPHFPRVLRTGLLACRGVHWRNSTWL